MVAEAVLRQEGDEASAAAGSSSSSSSGAGTSSSSSTVSQSQDGYDCKLQLKAYALVDVTTKEDCVPVMVSITAEHAPPRAAVDVVLALHVDIRCTAPANWHDLLKDATKVVVDRLGHDDRLATVPSFQEKTITITPPPKLRTGPKFLPASQPITVPLEPKFLPASQAKNALQLVAGSQAMRGSITMGSVLETAVSVLSARGSDEKKQRAGYIIIISNSNDKSISSQLTWKLQCVHAFGFCDAHNSNAMRAITGNRDSTCGVLDEGGEITNGFVGTIDNITSSAAVEPVEVKIECSEKVLLSSIDAPRINHLISYDEKMGLVWRNVRADTATNFMVYVMIPGNDHNRNALPSSLLSFEVKHRSGGAPQKFEKVIVDVMKGMEVSKQMVAEMRRWEAVRIVAGIVAKYCKGDGECEELHAAADDLRLSWISCYKEEAHDHLISHLDAQIRDMEIRLHNNYMWLEYMHSWLSHQWWKLPLQLKFMKKQRLQEDTIIDEPDLVQQRILLLANVDDIPNKIRKPGLLPVLIHIKAPMSGLAKKKRAPIDMVAVLDITGEVNDETKMNLLQAMDHIMMRLSHYDKLALILIPVPSQHAAATGCLSPMDKEMRGAYTKLLSSIVMPHQLNKKATGCLPIATKTASATNTNTIPTLPESLARAYKILDERPPDDKNRLGIVIVISDRNDDLNTSAMALSFNYSVHAFGFRGLDRNARVMHHIASKSNGIYAIIEDGGQITNDFKDCINKITSIIVEDVKVDINIRCTSKSWRLHTIESGHFRSSISHDSKSGSILAGALYAGAEKRFLVYVGNDVHEDDYHNLSKVFTVDIMHPSMLPSSNTEKKRPQDGQDATFKSAEVVKEIVRVEEVKIARAFAATYGDPNIVLGQLEELHRRLEPDKAQTDTDDVRSRPEGLAKAAAIVSITSIMTEELEESSRLSYMLSWLSFQELTEQPLPMALRKRHRRRVRYFSQPSPDTAADLQDLPLTTSQQ